MSYAPPVSHAPSDPNVGLPPGWIARYDQQSQHWFYVDERVGKTQWERPGTGYGPPPGVPPPDQRQSASAPYTGGGAQASYYGGGGGQGYGGQQQSYGSPAPVDDRGYHQNWANHQDAYAHDPATASHAPPAEPPKKNHNVAYGALGVGAGLLGGLFVAHEAGDIKDDFEEDKYKVENGFEQDKDRLEDAPDRLAGWAGNKVGNVEGDYDDAKYDVEDFPENAAGWAGQKVGNVEGDFQRVDDSYDNGRDNAYEDRRYDDDNNDYGRGGDDQDY